MKASDLRPNPKNPRKISDKKLEMLKKSIKEFGDLSGFVYNKTTGNLVGGHQRLKVIPPDSEIRMDTQTYGHIIINGDRFSYREVEWDEIKEKAANIAANKHGGEFDIPGLNEWLLDLDSANFDMDLTGFDNEELENLMAPVSKQGQCDEDEVPEKVESIARRGDVWQLGDHRLMCGDSTSIDDVEKLMCGEKAEMAFCDPPYGVSYQKKNKMLNRLQSPKGGLESAIHGDDLPLEELKNLISSIFTNIYLMLADKSSYYITAPQGGELGMMMMMMMMQESGIPCRHMIVWVKNNAAFSMNRLDYDYRHEPILYGWSKGRTHKFYGNGQFKNSVWEIDRENNKLHPTMKPVGIIENALLNSTLTGDRVIDLCGGSGSTLIACEKTNRKCFMMEIDPHYCDIIVSRFEKFSGKKANLLTRNDDKEAIEP